jgi:hypothetical protein
VLAAVVFGVAYDGGEYDVVARHTLAVAVWWAVALLVASGLAPREPLGRLGVAAAALLALFTAWTGLSIAWAASAERAVLELDRAALYLGVFTLAYLLVRRADIGAWCDGLALGLSATAALALASRFFPGHFAHSGVEQLLPGVGARLTYPVDYWNGLGILVALAVPLLLRAAVAESQPVVRGAALVPVPGIAAVVFLASSRGAIAAAVVGTAFFLGLTADRWRALAAIATAAAGAVAAVLVLRPRNELVNGPLDSAAAVSQGHEAALFVGLICLATGGVFALATWRLRAPRPSAAAGWALGAVVLIAVVAGVALSHPGRVWNDFKQPPGKYAQTNFAAAHLLSGRGNGRWQFWTAAVDEFRSKPVGGRGAGSWEAWWLRDRSIAYFTRYTHSLYLQVLGELGIAGLLLLLGAFGAALGGALAVRASMPPETRIALAGAAGGFMAYAIGSGIDWMWQLPVVTVVGFVCLGLLARLASPTPLVLPNRSVRAAIVIAVAVASLAALVVEASPLLGELRLRDSQAAAARNDSLAAERAALDAHRLEPWAATPFLQLALLYERAGQLAAANRAIDAATTRDPDDWRLWLIASRLQVKNGAVGAAVRSIRRARALDPLSPLLRQVGSP